MSRFSPTLNCAAGNRASALTRSGPPSPPRPLARSRNCPAARLSCGRSPGKNAFSATVPRSPGRTSGRPGPQRRPRLRTRRRSVAGRMAATRPRRRLAAPAARNAPHAASRAIRRPGGRALIAPGRILVARRRSQRCSTIAITHGDRSPSTRWSYCRIARAPARGTTAQDMPSSTLANPTGIDGTLRKSVVIIRLAR